ncbi:MAG TPA: hypothetical protein VFD91_03080 [Mariniphaga sp.]|nr:hypothetical protein [Mariniphaga sp.]
MAIRNMKDVKRKKQQLEFEAKFYKKEMLSSGSNLFGNFSSNFRSLAFDFGFGLISKMIFSRKKKHKVEVH